MCFCLFKSVFYFSENNLFIYYEMYFLFLSNYFCTLNILKAHFLCALQCLHNLRFMLHYIVLIAKAAL